MALRAVPDHPKFARLKALLGVPKGATLGWLESMWHFTGRFTPHGNIGKYSDSEIEAWVEWNGKPGELMKALVDSEWIDRSDKYRLLVHDWHLHADNATKLAVKRSKKPFCIDSVETCVHKVEEVETVCGLPGAGPVPAPEPVPEAEAKAAPLDDGFPEGLSTLQYASGILERRCIPSTFKLRELTGSTVSALARLETLEVHRAAEVLEKRIEAAQARGEPITTFWLTDGKWRGDQHGTTNGTRGAAVGRVERSLGAWERVAAKRRAEREAYDPLPTDASVLPPPGVS